MPSTKRDPQQYFVGDIQGCLDELKVLLDKVEFNPRHDTLYLTGDLVARGPKSLETLRYIKSLGNAAQTVLGNHDLHLLATYCGLKKAKPGDKLDSLLKADDADELIHWLRRQPLLRRVEQKVIVTHAGISPQWSIAEAQSAASEVQEILSGKHYREYLANMYQNTPESWCNSLTGYERFRYIVNCFSRMRFCRADGSLELKSKCAPEKAADDLLPWFRLRHPKWQSYTLVFGHWASLMGQTDDDQIIGLDTGCVWGNRMTLWRLSDRRYFTTAAIARTAL